MPLESATYISDLEPEWPLGTDPRSAGDDHIRMTKQSLQNTFPNINAPIKGTPTQINDLTDHVRYFPWGGEGTPPDHIAITNADNTAYLPVMGGALDVATMQTLGQATLINWGQIQNIFYPVGHVLMTARAGNPVDWLGFGTWIPVVGYLAAAGDVADSRGYLQSIIRAHSPGYWRVANDQIIAVDIGATVDWAGDHAHSAQGMIGNNDTNTEGGGATTYGETTQTTSTAGGHGHAARAHLGAGSGTDSGVFYSPYTGYYVWERTA